jgi:hypothetical protein
MGTRSGGNGGGQPPDGLPDLPPEWGIVVIPDDPSELAQESARVRRELRRDARQRRWRRRLHLPPPKAKPATDDEDAPTLGVPLLVISIAVIATLVSLFAVAWPNTQQRPHLQPTAVATTPAEAPATGPAAGPPAPGTQSTGPAAATSVVPSTPDAGVPPAIGPAPPPG